MADFRLLTPRLELRPLQAGDIDMLHAIWTAPGVRRFLWDDEIIPYERTAGVVPISEELFRARGFGLWAVREIRSGAVIGFAGIWPFRDPPEYELLYGIAEACWRRGYGIEAARAVMTYCFDVLKKDSVRASSDAANVASVRVLEKLGFAHTHCETIGGLETMFFERMRDAVQE